MKLYMALVLLFAPTVVLSGGRDVSGRRRIGRRIEQRIGRPMVRTGQLVQAQMAQMTPDEKMQLKTKLQAVADALRDRLDTMTEGQREALRDKMVVAAQLLARKRVGMELAEKWQNLKENLQEAASKLKTKWENMTPEQRKDLQAKLQDIADAIQEKLEMKRAGDQQMPVRVIPPMSPIEQPTIIYNN